ncbi:MAG: hypothetical protein LBT44_06755 [Clostridiales bacterium]|nr:hypothetical protein [Clostridiales bacterium]
MKRSLIVAAISALVIISILIPSVILPAGTYSEAEKSFDSGQYNHAFTLFASLGNYKDAPELSEKSKNLWLSTFIAT